MMQFYSKCYTLGARIRVKYTNITTSSTATANVPVVVGLTVSTGTPTLSALQDAIGVGLTEYKIVQANPQCANFEMAIDVGRFMDVPDVLNRSDLYCTAAGNTPQIVVGHLWVQSLLAAASVGAFVVDLEMDCVFTDPNPFI